jgi:hypothetical protein
MQVNLLQGVTTAPSTAQVLEQWSSGYRPDHPPSHIGQRANGWTMSMQTPIFKGVMNDHPLAKRLANGPTDEYLLLLPCLPLFRQLADQNAKNMRFSRGF